MEADCAPCGPRGLHTVAIELTLKGESTPLFKLLPGERKPLKIHGVDYVFRLNNANVHPDARYCGTSGWAVYRKDLAIGE